MSLVTHVLSVLVQCIWLNKKLSFAVLLQSMLYGKNCWWKFCTNYLASAVPLKTMCSVMSVKVLLEKPHEHVLHCLVLVYLTARSYYDSSASDSLIASWSDEEDERERQRDSPCTSHQMHSIEFWELSVFMFLWEIWFVIFRAMKNY